MRKVKFQSRIEIRNFYLFRVAPLLLIPSFALWWVLDAYLQIDVYNLLSYFPGEPPGNVQVGDRHLGVHTFGDYLLAHEWAMHKSPWNSNISPPSQYPPLAILCFRLLGLLPYWLGLLIFGLTALVIICWIILRNISSESVGRDERFRLLPVCILSAGVISVFDRGNSVVWLIGPLYLWMLYSNSQRDHPAAFWLSVSICLKIYPIFLAGALLIRREFKQFFLTLFYATLLSGSSLLLLVPNPMTSFSQFIHNLINYGNQGVGGTIGHTLNLAGAIGRTQLFIMKLINPSSGVEQVKGIVTHPLVIGLIYLAIVYLILSFRALPKSIEMYYLMSILWMVTDLSYIYNTCVLIVAIAFDMQLSSRHEPALFTKVNKRLRFFEQSTIVSTYLAVILTLAPIAIPIYKNLENGWHTIITFSWLFAVAVGLLYSLSVKFLHKKMPYMTK